MSIASEIARLQQAKADLKTAINAKGQSIADETIDEYADFVDAIEVGGGGAGSGDYLVRFIDYDGTILKEEYVDSGNAATAPTSPDHTADGLTFDEWNNAYSNITHDLDVGATYYTTDGKTHAFFTLTVASGKTLHLSFNKSDSSTMTVDWGDLSVVNYTTSGAFEINHTYTNYGDYELTICITSGSGTYGLGGATNSSCFWGDQYQKERETIREIWLGEEATLYGYCFYYAYSLTKIMLPSTIGTTIGDYSFYYCRALKTVVVPDGVTDINSYAFSTCATLETICAPISINTVGNNAFFSCYRLNNTVFNAQITTWGDSAFRACRALTKVRITSGTTTMGASVFMQCESITSITIPSTLSTFNASVFYGIYAGLREIVIPNTVTTLGDGCFNYCHSLSSVTMSNGVSNIPASLFASNAGCLEYDFSSFTSVPTLANINAFESINSLCKIKVPTALYAIWVAATNWSNYANYIEAV